MDTFLRAATLGRGSVPALPDDVRRHIWAFTYPRPVLWCAVCGVHVLERHEDGAFTLHSSTDLWVETPRCIGCVGHPSVPEIA